MTEQQQIADRDRAARAATFAVDQALIDNYAELRSVPSVVVARVTVEAALGYLIGHGLITVAPAEEWPEWLQLDTPEHLRPDVEAKVSANQHLRNALRLGGEPQ